MLSLKRMVKVILEVKWVKAKSALVKSRIYDVDYALNPYVGCEHGCLYCYARFMCKYAKTDKEWGDFVHVKINLPKILASEVRRLPEGTVLISSVTDPYQPLERKYLITRRSLEILSRTNFSVIILTKSDLVLRDIDKLKHMENVEVGFTITTLDESFSSILEPKAPSPLRRLKALEILKENGIDTFGFIAPFIPIISEKRLDSLLEKLAEINVDRVMVDTLNIKYGNLPYIRSVLKRVGLWTDIRQILECEYTYLQYYQEIKTRIKDASNELGLDIIFLF